MPTITIYIDADACPVKQEIYRVAERHAGKGTALKVFVVSNSPIAVPRDEIIERVVVGPGMDEADNWIAEHANPFNPMMQLPNVHALWNTQTAGGIAALNYEVTRQAQMIGYINVFKLLMVITLCLIPLVLLLRDSRQGSGGAPSAALD